METKLLDEVIACIGKDKRHYRYFQGAYAPRLLNLLIPSQIKLAALKRTRFRPLLEHKTVKPLIAECGDGMLNREALDAIWLNPSQPFLLSLSRWGGRRYRDWHQTSRFGENLVLQLNMSHEHIQQWQTWIGSQKHGMLNSIRSQHPVQQRQGNSSFRDTLAWCRIDLDFKHNEALIEEIQSDAVRFIKRRTKRYQRCRCQECLDGLQYVKWFEAYSAIWSEAMLMASLEFIHNELGINRIFMHTARSGWQVKNMDKNWQPPKSLYSNLPKKFAFKQTWAAPEFLLDSKCYQKLIRRQPDIDFYQITMNELQHLNCGTQAA